MFEQEVEYQVMKWFHLLEIEVLIDLGYGQRTSFYMISRKSQKCCDFRSFDTDDCSPIFQTPFQLQQNIEGNSLFFLLQIQVGLWFCKVLYKQAMIYQKVRVQFQKEEHIFNLQKIQSLSHLHQLLRQSFTTLPHQYQIYIDSDPIQEFTYRVFWSMKMDKKEEFNLIIFKEQANNKEKVDQSVKVQILQFQHELPVQTKMKKLGDIQDDKILEQEIKKIIEKTQKRASELCQEKLKENSLIVNEHVQCDRCFQFPIKGKIYKCLVCKDYDLCEICESKNQHYFHPLLKVTKKSHYPQRIDILFNKKNKILMDSLEEQSIKLKRQALQMKKQMPNYFEVDPSSLKQTVIISKSFLSQMIDAPY